jgi:hypothetical protein
MTSHGNIRKGRADEQHGAITAPASRRTVWLHIGLHKTGSTYLQSMLRANRDHLAAQGVHIAAAGPREYVGLPAWDLMGRRPRDSRDDRVIGKWNALATDVRESPLPVGLYSSEYLSLATVRQARRAVQSFPEAEVQVIVTARDFGRVLLSAWQEAVKNGQTLTFAEFAESVRDHQRRAQGVARSFWLRHDLPAVLETWRAVLPADRVYVVTVPQPGSPPEVLLERFCSLIRVDPSCLVEAPRWRNETLGVVGAELVRRLNVHVASTLNQRQYERVVRNVLVRECIRPLGSARFGLPTEYLAWAREEARRGMEDVLHAGHPLIGEMDELLPADSSAEPDPASASESDLLEASLVALAGLSHRYADAWWQNRRGDRPAPATTASVRAASVTRAGMFRAKRMATELADRSPLAARALGAYLSARSAARRHVASGRKRRSARSSG